MAPAINAARPVSSASYSQGKLSARPRDLTTAPLAPREATPLGMHPLRFTHGPGRNGLLYVPQSYAEPSRRPAPLIIMMHGAGGNAKGGMSYMLDLAEEAGSVIMSPQSCSSTWDAIRDGFGRDVELIDKNLTQVFQQYEIDHSRVAIGGFSDGASYALSLGLTNGQLFSHIIGFSPGFMAPGVKAGQPDIFITHGTGDAVLPIDRCSRHLIPKLENMGYDVAYQEFEGPHVVQPSSANEAMQWFLETQLKQQGMPMKKIGDKVIVT